jgi:membrane-bound PQQ-dependent dehydrogenase (glucose/quinate/shikimate family)
MATNPDAAAAARRPIGFILLLGLNGLAYAGGGLLLLRYGGSPYYFAGGLAMLASAVLLFRRDALGAWIYAAFLGVTLVWALAEAGRDGWALVPRLMIPALLAIWFAARSVRRWLSAPAPGARVSVVAGAFSLVVLAGVAFTPGPGPAAPLPEALDASKVDPALIAPANGEWPEWGGTRAGTRFSPLTQITPDNVGKLQKVWTYRTGVVQQGETSGMEATPLMVNGTLYFCTQTNIVIALDPETGTERWRYDPQTNTKAASLVATCRGVAYLATPQVADCPKRIIAATFDIRLLAINADTGKPCEWFGNKGTVDLKLGMGLVDPGFYYVSSAPTIVRNRIILGGWVADNVRVGEPSGVVRAFDAVTGAFVWAWDVGRPGQHGLPSPGETFTPGTPNVWGPMSGDEALGLVYLPTGNATPDHWGGHRAKFSDESNTALVAVDADTGEERWRFQMAHHDIWDYDNAAQPTLVDVTVNGERVPAVLQATKTGLVFMLDRRTGKPLAAVEERPVAHDGAPGDTLSPTQPFSTGMPQFTAPLTEADMWGITPYDQLYCRVLFRSMRYDGEFTPLGTERKSLMYPGMGGGMNWGGVSVDPERGVMLVNALYIGTMGQLVPRAEYDAYVEAQKKQQQSEQLAGNRKVFHNLDAPFPQLGTPFAVRLGTFQSPLQIPCQKPPYGTMSAVDLSTGKLLWQKPLGKTSDSGPLGIPFGLPLTMGVPTFGGSITTRSGLVFIGATHERSIRAFDIRNGNVLWESRLPAAAIATPSTYLSPKSHRQFVVTIASGHRTLRAPLGDYVEAFALPE